MDLKEKIFEYFDAKYEKHSVKEFYPSEKYPGCWKIPERNFGKKVFGDWPIYPVFTLSLSIECASAPCIKFIDSFLTNFSKNPNGYLLIGEIIGYVSQKIDESNVDTFIQHSQNFVFSNWRGLSTHEVDIIKTLVDLISLKNQTILKTLVCLSSDFRLNKNTSCLEALANIKKLFEEKKK